MPDTFTAELNLTLPEIGASDDTWGDKLNDDLDILDALFAATGTGTVVTRDSSDRAAVTGIALAKAAANARLIEIFSTASKRWDLGADATAEAGSNAGSKFKLNRYSDAAAFLGSPMIVDRDTGLVTFETTPKVSTNSIYHEGNSSTFVTPIGAVSAYLGITPPTNWLFLDGSAVSRTTYATLFALIGITFGAGNGTTTFNLPDLRGRVIAGWEGMAGGASPNILSGVTGSVNGDTFGASGGEETHLLTAAEGPKHTHTGTTSSNGAHTHTYTKANSPQAAANTSGISPFNNSTTDATSSDGAHTHTMTTDAMSVGDGAHNNVQPTTILSLMVRAL